MRLFALFFIFSILLLTSISLAAELIVGVSPPVLKLGEIERGTTKIVKFYLVTPSSEPLLVSLQSEKGNLDFFARDEYKNILFNYSEEEVGAWVEFLKNPVELAPSNETLQTKGGVIKGWREISFLLNVPKNAEPGYHLIRINPYPSVPSEVLGQAGARVVAITSLSVLFNVPGEARREGLILDVVPGNYVGNRLEINTYFKNTGSVTISATAAQTILKNGEAIATLSSSTELVKPNETKILKTLLPLDGISFGDYNVSTSVGYTTGLAQKNSTITISPPAPLAPLVPPPAFPYWIIMLIIIIAIAIGIYKWYK
jgi:hypothetical protein